MAKATTSFQSSHIAEHLEEKQDQETLQGKISDKEMVRAALYPHQSPLTLRNLVEAGGNVNARDENDLPLLWLITMATPPLEFSEKLMEGLSFILSRPDFRLSSDEAKASITTAVSGGKLSMLKCLLASEAITKLVPNILQDAEAGNSSFFGNQVNDYSLLELALMYNWQGSNDEIVIWLREHKAAFNPSLEKFIFAVNSLKIDLVKAILADPIANDTFMQNFAEQLVINIAALKILVNNELILSVLDFKTHGNTLLGQAKLHNTSGDYNDVIKLLISKGAVYTPKPQDLINAIHGMNPNLVAELLDNLDLNGPINIQKAFDDSVEQASFVELKNRQNAFKIVQTILDHKILGHYNLVMDSNIIWRSIASAYGDIELLELLLSNQRINEHLNDEMFSGLNILEQAISDNFAQDSIDLFKKYGAVCQPTAQKFQVALWDHNDRLIVALTDASTEDSLKIPDANGYTALSHLIHFAASLQLGNFAAAASNADNPALIIPEIFKALQAMIYRKGSAEGNVLMLNEGDIECLFKLTDFFPYLKSPCKIESFNIRDHSGSMVPHPRSRELLDKLRTNSDSANELFEYIAELMPKDVNAIVMGYIGAYVANTGLSNHDLTTISSSRYSDDKIEVAGIEVVGDDGAAAGLI